MNFTKVYAVYPGEVKSKTDGDVHYLSFHRLCRLYNVNPAQCVDMSRESARNAIIEDISSLIPLTPLYSGDYPQLQEDPLSHP